MFNPTLDLPTEMERGKSRFSVRRPKGRQMSIQPEGDDLRKAVKWIADMLNENSKKPVMKLIEEASLKFDLTPNDQEFLMRTYIKKC